MLKHLKDVADGKTTIGHKRSSKWPGVRHNHLKLNPTCALCGGTEKLEVHHIEPFHLHPELELDPGNLITLCEGNSKVTCHLWLGHLGNYKKINPNVVEDCVHFGKRFAKDEQPQS